MRTFPSLGEKSFAMIVLCIFVTLFVAVQSGYHDEIGIPLAARRKEYEDKLWAEVPEMESRIVGGEIAPVFAHPYLGGLLIQLQNHFISLCGSSLVTPQRLVTAAHCVEWAESIKVVLGSTFIFRGGIRIITRDFKKHPQFDDSQSLDHDIGLVFLPFEIETSETLHPVRIPRKPDESEVIGEWAVAAGWGLSSESHRGKLKSEDLLVNEVSLRIIDKTVCENEFDITHVNTICTSGDGGVAVCDGDSGGPLVVTRKGQKMLLGVISYGRKPCGRGHPSGFIRVQDYISFILQKI